MPSVTEPSAPVPIISQEEASVITMPVVWVLMDVHE